MEPVYVASPLLPSLDDLVPLLERIWASRMVTNAGSVHNALERALGACLGVPVARLFASGTSGLQCALLASRLPRGAEIVTTPLTFPATVHAIAASGLTPVFADIDPRTLCIDPAAVERAITPRTVGVLGVHVYGTICDDAALGRICADRGLWLMYDAAHAFSARRDSVSTAAMGDLSVFSLHATKLYNTIEGGLVTTCNADLSERLRLARDFGIASETEVSSIGINGKMSELHAAVGLLNLDLFEEEKAKRAQLRREYDAVIGSVDGLETDIEQPGVERPQQYYLVRVDPDRYGATRDMLVEALKARGIVARRYFSPICTDYDCYRDMTIVSLYERPVAERVKTTLMCLPFHSRVTPAHVAAIGEEVSRLARPVAV